MFYGTQVIHISNKKRVQVSFSEEQMEIIKEMSGEMGNTNSEIVRSIVISWLAEKSFISSKIKNRRGENEKSV